MTGEDVTATESVRARLDALRDEHCYITSVDVCCHCGDCECDGIGCIAGIDPDAAGAGDGDHYERLENLHQTMRDGQAWRVMQALLEAGEQPLVALMLAQEALAVANNQTVIRECEECGQTFEAQTPCDLICTACRLYGVPDPRCPHEFPLPSWMGPEQDSPCRCDLPVGHIGDHSCRHVRGALL